MVAAKQTNKQTNRLRGTETGKHFDKKKVIQIDLQEEITQKKNLKNNMAFCLLLLK